MLVSSLDVVRRHAGADSAADLVLWVTSANLDEVTALAEALVTDPPTPGQHVAPNEIWPLVNARASLLSRGAQTMVDAPGPAGLNLMAAMSPREIGSSTFSNSVMRALLYSHGLVIEDPVVMAADLYLSSPEATRNLGRRFIQAAVGSLAEIDALIDDAIVQTFYTGTIDRTENDKLSADLRAALDAGASFGVDDVWDAFEANYVEGLSPSLRSLWRRIRAGDRSPPLELVEKGISETDTSIVEIFVNVVAELRPTAVVDNTIEIVSSALGDIRRLGRRHDILCPSPLYADLLFLGDTDPVASRRVHQLANTPVPNIADLSLRDVVSIRGNSEAFALWRSRLSTGLERAHHLRDELGPDVDVSEIVSEVLRDAREQMDREAKSSRVFGKGGFTAFAAGALGGGLGGATGGLTAAFLGAAGGAIPTLVQAQLDRRGTVPDYVRRHYLVFDKIDA